MSRKQANKALVDSGASKSILVQAAEEGLLLQTTKEPKKWLTTAGILQASYKTKKIKSKTLFHIVDLKVKRYNIIIV